MIKFQVGDVVRIRSGWNMSTCEDDETGVIIKIPEGVTDDWGLVSVVFSDGHGHKCFIRSLEKVDHE